MFNHTGEYQHYFGLTGTPDFMQALADFYTRSVEDDIVNICKRVNRNKMPLQRRMYRMYSVLIFKKIKFPAALKKFNLFHKLLF